MKISHFKIKATTLLLGCALCAIPIEALSRDDPAPERSITLAERRLQALVRSEEAILQALHRAGGEYDEEQLRRRFQELVDRYDRFIGDHPDFAAGYVAYGRLLERIGEDRAARAMYLHANRRDPNIPFVKNQLGNFLAESGEFDTAMAYYLAAIELDPEEPVYHYQLGTLLHTFREEFVEQEILSRNLLDEKMLKAFAEAARLSPDTVALTYRHAEAYYDLAEPRWDEALEKWEKLRESARPGIERQTIDLHKANIALKRGKTDEARRLLETVDAPPLQRNRNTLLSQLEDSAPDGQPIPRSRERDNAELDRRQPRIPDR